MEKRIPQIIAIDGPAASGKSTIAHRLAQQLGYLYFDTGIMYRAVTWVALQRGLNPENKVLMGTLANELQIDVSAPSVADGRSYDVWVDGQDITWAIRKPEVDANVSVVSANQAVRSALTRQQRRIAMQGRIVMVGRDIGTVVLPEADLKIYLDASVEERARRRYEEAVMQGERVQYNDILNALRMRDEIDSTRDVAPLRAAKDAWIIQTDGLNADEVFHRIQALIFNVNST